MVPPLRSLPRVFLDLSQLEVSEDGSIPLPAEEVDKFRKVLRLEEGSHVAVLPGDGRLIRCEFRRKRAFPIETTTLSTEPSRRVILAQAFPKGDRLDTILRMGTEIGVAGFVLFPAERSVVRWDSEKVQEKSRRFRAIVREAAEQSYRTVLPTLGVFASLTEVLSSNPNAQVLSEVESLTRTLSVVSETTLVVGPEGGWAQRELDLIGDRGVTLGPLVLRTDTAGIAAASAILFAP